MIIELQAENEFRLTKEELEAAITPKTKLLVLPFPNNPTGAVMERHNLEEVAQVVREHDLFVLSDEIYAELTLCRRHGSCIDCIAARYAGAYDRDQRFF